jgi:hypothetical protein
MAEKKYTPKEMDEAERLATAIRSVPDDKRPAFTRMIEAMILGAEMADRLTMGSAPQA